MSQLLCDSTQEVEQPTPANLPEFLPYACGQLRASFSVLVETQLQDEYVSKSEDKMRKGKKSMAVVPQTSSSGDIVDGVATETAFPVYDSGIIRVMGTLDTTSKLVGLIINRCDNTPRLLLQVIGLCVPYCPHLNTLQLHQCKLTGQILYEISKFLPQSQIDEISLDGSSIPDLERNYYMLLERPSKLRNLSLARCNISNIDCELLFAQLEHPLPASKTLMTLNLSSNFITDIGANFIGSCLRSNRCLRYLNLADNQITDDGALNILSSLVSFPLIADEIYKKKQRFMEYIRLRENVYNKFYKEVSDVMATKAFDEFSKNSKRKASTKTLLLLPASSKDIIATKAANMTDDLLGRYSDPFSTQETFYRYDYIHSIGNTILCCLNFAYNNLGFLTVNKLVNVLKYQQGLVKSSGKGLLYVQLEGNCLPCCRETNILQDLLEQSVFSQLTRVTSQSPRKERGKLKK